jgi:hypothetical protein
MAITSQMALLYPPGIDEWMRRELGEHVRDLVPLGGRSVIFPFCAAGGYEALLAGEPPVDAGPAPDRPQETLAPSQSKVVSLLTAAGGCVVGGGDPAGSLELALLAADDPEAGRGGLHPRLPELIEEARAASVEAVPALALALTLAATPGVRSGVLTA